MIQDALNDWTNIVMASGGSNKPKKCHVSIADYKYDKGVAKMKSKAEILRDHPNLKFTVHSYNFYLNDLRTRCRFSQFEVESLVTSLIKFL